MKRIFSINFSPALCITGVNLGARAVQLVSFVFIGNLYGADSNTDTVLLLQAPLLILMSVSAGTFEAIIMPAMFRAVKTKSTGNLLSFILSGTIKYLVPLTVILLLVANWLVERAEPALMLILSPMPLLSAYSSIYIGILNAEGYFLKAVSGPFYGAILSLFFILCLPISSISLAFIFLSFEIGRFAGLRCQAKKKVDYYKKKHARDADHIIPWAVSGAKYQAIGSLLVALNPFVDYMFAKQLGQGAVTHVEYAARLWNLVPVLFNGPLTLFYSKISQVASNGSVDKRKIHYYAIRFGCYAFILGGIAILFSDTFIYAIYGFGRMDAENRIKLSTLLSCYFIGTGPFFGGLIYVKTLSAVGKLRVIAVVSIFSIGFNVCFNTILVNEYGLNGIGLSTSLTYFVTMIVLGVYFAKYET